jgi:macrolide transport system ATP-binding/permease protein
MSVIEMTDITRSYQMGKEELRVLKDITLNIEAGEFVAIMGPSGSGKSTLMQTMGLLDRPTSGRYCLLGRDVSRLSDDEGAVLRSQMLGFVFQLFNLLPRTSALGNVMLPAIYSARRYRTERGRELLRQLGLADRMNHQPNQLSGGQQQRVAIARALVNKPQVLFADEPTGNLSSEQAKDILRLLRDLNQQGLTIVLVTHELEIAAYVRRIITLKDGLIIEDKSHGAVPAEQGRLGSIPVVSVREATQHILNLESPRFSLAELKEHISSAFRAMVANKVRSALSLLGIFIGVASVIAMLAVGAGAQASIQARLLSLGSNVIMLFPGAPNTRGIMGVTGDYTRLTLDDVKAVKSASPYISDIYGEVEGGHERVVYKNQNTVVEVQGVPLNYESIRNSTPILGRFFTEEEDLARVRVALLGQTVVHNLFEDKNPVGETVKINRINFKVIGVLPQKGASGFSDQDALVVIPLHTAMYRLLNTRFLHEMAIQCDSPESIDKVISDAASVLRKRHRLASNKENDFTLRNNAEMQNILSSTTQTLSFLLLSVAAISLLVGGVGIMNIMLVSVNERTREIGLRKAVGAARRAILVQFLLEASVLSVIGGIIGIMLGISAATAISKFAGWITIVTPQSIVLAFAFSAGVGVVFGFWPAYQASLRSPIEALRYE